MMILSKSKKGLIAMQPNNTYFQLIDLLKREIKHARLRAHMAVNHELVMLY